MVSYTTYKRPTLRILIYQLIVNSMFSRTLITLVLLSSLKIVSTKGVSTFRPIGASGEGTIKIIGSLLVLFLLSDSIDCGLVQCNPTSRDYIIRDKLNDIFMYILTIFLFYSLFDLFTLRLLISLVIWRSIGLLRYLMDSNKINFIYFFDGINVTIFVYFLSLLSSDIRSFYNFYLFLGLFSKIFFEKIHSQI